MEARISRRRGSNSIGSGNGDRMGKGVGTITIDDIIVNNKLRRALVITKREKMKCCRIPIKVALIEEIR